MSEENNYAYYPPLEPGYVIPEFGYRITEHTVNAGGFGRIYRAEGSRCEKDGSPHYTALKEFCVFDQLDSTNSGYVSSYLQDDVDATYEAMKKNFYREAEILKTLLSERDRHVPFVHLDHKRPKGVFEHEGRLFYAMTFIDGDSLYERVGQGAFSNPMGEQMAVDYIVQVGKVLHKVHGLNFAHCDISPRNIMVCYDYAVLVDFGNARSYKASLNELTDDSCLVIGTGGFEAPMEFYGTTQSDVYSLAATLYFLLTGLTLPTWEAPGREATIVETLKAQVDPVTGETVSDATIDAVLHATQPTREQCTKRVKDFLWELPHEHVFNALLAYNDHQKRG